MVSTDTIAAIATPVGEGAIGMVRLSGPRALFIADKMFRARSSVKPSEYASHTVHYGFVVDPNAANHRIDEVLLTVMRQPRTFTREDVVEISCHGGALVLRRILEAALSYGARLAQPGEFTKRAFLNGRIDLAKAEAVLDIIRAKTDSALQLGIEQLSGNLSGRVTRLREDLTDALSHIEADIDFSDQHIQTRTREKLKTIFGASLKELTAIINDAEKVTFLREGIRVTICGRPNVGKSLLFNALLKKNRAIVTPIAGTTRDIIEECVNFHGIGIRLIDTAGMMKPRDLIDQHAMRLAKDSVAASDVIVAVFDASKPFTTKDHHVIKELKGKKVIAVFNKIDLPQRVNIGMLRRNFKTIIKVSALTKKNLDALEKAIAHCVYKGKMISGEGLVTANARHIEQIKEAQSFLAKAQKSFRQKLSVEFIALDLKLALDCLGRITGETVDDAVLDKIFSEFCIGK